MARIVGGLLAILCAALGAAASQPYGIDSRSGNSTLFFDATNGGAGDHPVPDKLSDVPALLAAGLDTDQTGAGIFPYKPSAELWSDGVLKSRYFAVPGLTQVTYAADGGWDFPNGSALIKNFRMPMDFRDPEGTAKRIETRLMVRVNNMWYFYSYEWNEAESDATLLSGAKDRAFSLTDADGVAFDYSWYYPSRQDCRKCHHYAANFVLGVNTAQMNGDFAYPASGVTDNQIRTLEHIGLFDAALPGALDTLPKSPPPFDESAGTLEERAFSYLNANCAYCHRPSGPAFLDIDFRWGLALGDRNLIEVPPSVSDLGIENAMRVAAGNPERSVLYQRINSREAHQMPPLGTSLVHEEAVALIAEWITSVPLPEGEGALDGEGGGQVYAADQDGNSSIDLSELLRVIQFYNAEGMHCDAATEDGFATGVGDQSCVPYACDYAPRDWRLSLSELLRVIQYFNSGGFHACVAGEDGYCPGTGG